MGQEPGGLFESTQLYAIGGPRQAESRPLFHFFETTDAGKDMWVEPDLWPVVRSVLERRPTTPLLSRLRNAIRAAAVMERIPGRISTSSKAMVTFLLRR